MEDRRACTIKSSRGIGAENAAGAMDVAPLRQAPAANAVTKDTFARRIEK